MVLGSFQNMSKAVDCFQKNAHKAQNLASDTLEDVCSRACSCPRTFALAMLSAWSVFLVSPYSLSFSSFLKEPSPDFLTQWYLHGPSLATLLHHRPLFPSSLLSPTSLSTFAAVTPPHTHSVSPMRSGVLWVVFTTMFPVVRTAPAP